VLQSIATEAVVRGLNHLLAAEGWARDALRPFAGRAVRLQAGPLHLQFAITSEGLAQRSDAPPDVAIEFDRQALAGALGDCSNLMRDAHISGDAELAQVLSQLAGRLRPDFEQDLSRLVGDAAAVRLSEACRALAAAAADCGRRLATQTADYLAGEKAVLLARAPVSRFTAELAAVAQAVELLADRIDRLG